MGTIGSALVYAGGRWGGKGLCWGMKMGGEGRGCLSHPTVWPVIILRPPFPLLRDQFEDEGSKGTKKHQLVSRKLLAFVPLSWSLGSLPASPTFSYKEGSRDERCSAFGEPQAQEGSGFLIKMFTYLLGGPAGAQESGACIFVCLEQSQCMSLNLSSSKVCVINRVVATDSDSWNY